MSDDIAHLTRLAQLLDEEREEARRRFEALTSGASDADLVADGLLLKAAHVANERPALMGRVEVTLGPTPDKPQQVERFAARPGSVVCIRGQDDAGRTVLGLRGVVAKSRRRKLMVVFDEALDNRGGPIDLLLQDDEVTLARLKKATLALTTATGRTRDLMRILLGVDAPAPTAGARPTLFDPLLHEDQQTAAWHGLFAPDVALIHGPPGTGKTRVVVEVIRQLVKRGERVLALCASNAAADNVALGVAAMDPGLALARVGHPARVDERLEKKTLSALTDDHERRRLAKKLVEDAFGLLRQASKRSRRGKDAWKASREARVEARKLFADARVLERQAADEVLRKTHVICGTLTGFKREIPRDASFDVLVVDEASQVLTPALFMALPLVSRVVLAGDHRQLPPTVRSKKAEAGGLGRTAFDALSERADAAKYSHMLRIQHRMHTDIMAFSSDRFYEGALQAHATVASHTLDDLALGTTQHIDKQRAVAWIDTAGAGYDEDFIERSAGRENPEEARVVARLVQDLLDAGLAPDAIGVLSPYRAQVALLSSQLADAVDAGLEIDSVDGFQGREKEAIVFSAVRSNPSGELGFLDDDRRLNVAVTRARRLFIGIGDSATLAQHPTWRGLIDHITAVEGYRSVFELLFE